VTNNRAELIQQIRFALANLAARNGHHEFEALCLEIARQTVSPNVVPATGPVAGRGDQGRDFETFRSRITPRLGETGLLLGIDGQDLVAFACTLQRSRLEQKIESDLETICSAGERVAAVVVYCETNVPVGSRHRIQVDARTRWDIAVDIIDGEGLSSLLADESLFWAATRYLSLPAGLAPTTESESAYDSDIERWRSREEPPSTFGDFLALRDGLRTAAFDPAHRGDVPFWLSRMHILADSHSTEIARRARYETILGTLRGVGNLVGVANSTLVEDFLTSTLASSDGAELADAAIVLMSCVGARLAGAIDIDNATLMRWNGRLRDHVTALLQSPALDDGRRCALLDVLGGLCLQPDIGEAQPPSAPAPIAIDRIMESIDSGAGPIDGATVPLVDRVAAVTAWLELARKLEREWLFPVDPLATRLAYMSPLISDIDGYEELTRLVDEAVGRRSGKSAVAERCRDRAIAHANAGRVRDALTEFHRARVEWLGGDTIRGSLLAQMFAAHCYLTLNLPLAARYFWLATAFLASRSPDTADLVAPALCGASTADYHAGSWFGALELADHALAAQAVLADDPWDAERFEYLSGTLFDLTIIDACARRLGDPYAAASSRVIDRFGLRPFLDEALPAEPWWEGLSTDVLGSRIANELGRPGFCDAGRTLTIAWRALGLDWRLFVANEYNSVIAAYRFGSILQVAAAELSRYELLIAPTQIRIHVTLRGGSDPDGRPTLRPSNDGREWTMDLESPDTSGAGEQAFSDAIAALLEILGDVSLLSPAELDELVRKALTEGLVERFAPMLLYDRIVPTPATHLADAKRQQGSPMWPGEAVPREHLDLRWVDTPGPGYTREEGEERVRSRYEAMRRLMPHSIRRLMRVGSVRATCEELRADGWKDWHILQALTSLIMSYRLSLLGTRNVATIEAAGRRMSQTPEVPDDPTPPAGTITLTTMRDALRGSMLVTLRSWGLSLRQPTPDFPALERFLGARYRFWADDAPHERWWEAAGA
jgi:hypothetical protein